MAGRITIELDRDDAEWLLAILVMKGHKLGSVAAELRAALVEPAGGGVITEADAPKFNESYSEQQARIINETGA